MYTIFTITNSLYTGMAYNGHDYKTALKMYAAAKKSNFYKKVEFLANGKEIFPEI